MYSVKDPVFAMDESFFLDGGSRLDDVEVQALTEVSERRSVPASIATVPDVGRCQNKCAPEGRRRRRDQRDTGARRRL